VVRGDGDRDEDGDGTKKIKAFIQSQRRKAEKELKHLEMLKKHKTVKRVKLEQALSRRDKRVEAKARQKIMKELEAFLAESS